MQIMGKIGAVKKYTSKAKQMATLSVLSFVSDLIIRIVIAAN